MSVWCRRLLLWAVSVGAAAGVTAEEWPRDCVLEEHFRGTHSLSVEKQRHEKRFPADEKRANFTYFNGVKELAVRGGLLTFTTTAPTAVLGWGNYIGAQTPAEVADLFREHNVVELRWRQSAERSNLRFQFWVDGAAIRYRGRAKQDVEVEGTDWQVVRFDPLRPGKIPTPDGFEIEIKAPVGARVEIAWVCIVEEPYEGYLRKEFVLPEGRVWKAVADVPWGDDRRWANTDVRMTLFVNGQRVERRTANGVYAVLPVDIAPYLKSGVNCVGLYGYHTSAWGPRLCLKATVVMESGDTVQVNSDTTWRRASRAPDGWCEPGFDDAGWQLCERARGQYEASQQVDLPADHSRLRLSNPFAREFFYGTTNDVRIDVEAPPGLAVRRPVLDVAWDRTDPDGGYTRLAEATVSPDPQQREAWVFPVNLGSQPGGVYTIACRLKDAEGNVLAEHMREPVVVIADEAPDEVACERYREGLDLEIEDRIDFTDPGDPHPNFEVVYVDRMAAMENVDEPRIVRKDGLVYRELVGRSRMSAMSYRIGEFAHPGDFYLMELDYPDDANRCIDVSISSKQRGRVSNSQTGVGAETGGKFYKTGTMQTLRWLHVADSGVHSVDILNSQDDWPAAAAELRIYHVGNRLPSAGSGSSRWYGIYTERCHFSSGHAKNFGSDTDRKLSYEESQELKKRTTLTRRVVMRLQDWLATCDRYAQYLEFAGQNLNHIGCVQYRDVSNTPMIRANIYYDAPRVTLGFRTMMANVLNMRGIAILGGIQLSQSGRLGFRTYRNNAQVARGAETIWMIDDEGDQYYGLATSTIVPNWQHPLFMKAYRLAIKDVVDTIGVLPHFKGITSISSLGQRNSYYFPAYGLGQDYDNSMVFSYDDLTVGRFERESGIDLGIDPVDPDRFGKRAALLRDPRVRPRFLEWRCKRLQEFFSEANAYLNGLDPDAQFVNIIGAGGAVDAYRYLMDHNEPYASMLKRFAIDLPALGRIPNHWLLRWAVSWQTYRGLQAQNPFVWIPKERDIVLSAYEGVPRRAAVCRMSWDEIGLYRPGVVPQEAKWEVVESDWIMGACKLRIEPQPGALNAREALIQAVITGDVQLLLTGFTDAALNLGHEQALREIMRPYTYLPRDRFETVLATDLESNLALRTLTSGPTSWLYVANPGYWHVKGTVSLDTGGPVLDAATGRRVLDGGNSVEIPVDLAAFGLAAYRIESSTLKVHSYTTQKPSARELSHMTEIMARVETLMTDPDIRVVLSAEDRDFMHRRIALVTQALDQGLYALAWSRLKHHRFWSFWQEFLEKAALAVAALPAELDVEPRSDDPESLSTLKAARAEGPIRVDGKLAEPAWGKVRFSAGFRAGKERLPALNETAVKTVYDEDALYLGVMCADRNPENLRAIATKGMQIWSTDDDAIAVFLQPDEAYPLYYQFAFNTQGVRFSQRIKGADKDYDFSTDWLAAAAPGDGYWTAEARFPFSALGMDGPGDSQWRINVGRAMRRRMLEPSAWSASVSWHAPDRFGKLVFAE